jgi:hypothetical protein
MGGASLRGYELVGEGGDLAMRTGDMLYVEPTGERV